MVLDPYFNIAMSGSHPIGIDLDIGFTEEMDSQEQRMRSINRALAPQATDVAISLQAAGFSSDRIMPTLEKYSEAHFGEFGDMLMFGDEPFSGDPNEFNW